MEVPPCPACGGEETDLLHASPGHATVRCQDCGDVRKVALPREKAVDLAVVFSDGARSWKGVVPAPPDEVVAVGDEFAYDDHRYLVTGVERDDGRRADKAVVQELKQIAAKRFDEVTLKLSVNEGARTRSHVLAADPEAPVHVGQVLDVDGRLVVVKSFKSDRNRAVRKGFLLARSIVRVFCEPAPEGARAGEVLEGRR